MRERVNPNNRENLIYQFRKQGWVEIVDGKEAKCFLLNPDIKGSSALYRGVMSLEGDKYGHFLVWDSKRFEHHYFEPENAEKLATEELKLKDEGWEEVRVGVVSKKSKNETGETIIKRIPVVVAIKKKDDPELETIEPQIEREKKDIFLAT